MDLSKALVRMSDQKPEKGSSGNTLAGGKKSTFLSAAKGPELPSSTVLELVQDTLARSNPGLLGVEGPK